MSDSRGKKRTASADGLSTLNERDMKRLARDERAREREVKRLARDEGEKRREDEEEQFSVRLHREILPFYLHRYVSEFITIIDAEFLKMGIHEHCVTAVDVEYVVKNLMPTSKIGFV